MNIIGKNIVSNNMIRKHLVFMHVVIINKHYEQQNTQIIRYIEYSKLQTTVKKSISNVLIRQRQKINKHECMVNE